MKIVFMGTPDFAVGCLETLAARHEVAAVFTQPDKPVGRKQVLTPPPVKVTAQKLGLPVYQPTTVKSGEAIEILEKINPDLIVVVAYGKILLNNILQLPRYGCVNVHASLLPKYRGASPIQWSIVCGEKITGVTTMLMDEGVDTGDILETEEVAIGDNETAGELFDRLAKTGAELIVKTVEHIADGSVVPKKQPQEGASHAPIITKEMAQLDFSRHAVEIFNAVRGYNPWPCAYFVVGGKRIKVYSCEVVDASGEPSTVIKADNELIIACGENAVKLYEIQPEGKKRMSAADMLRGNSGITLGMKVGE